MLQDSVVAIVPDEAVRDILPTIHRAGLGHVARLIRAGRSSVLEHLQRAGVPVAQAPEPLQMCQAALLINAAARSPMAASLVLQHGASQVWTVSALGAWNEIEDVILVQPNVHELPPHPARLVPGRAAPPPALAPPGRAPASDAAE
ncbi:MAG: hypothetical protein H0V37_00360 [Chloroflexia bacterium]|nr:hypothetical protein [Chloroflexia bacterium]